MFDKKILIDTAKALLAPGKGIIAMDESTPSCNERFEKVGIPQTEEMRRKYRELIITTPGLNECISGTILYDETIRQKASDNVLFIKKIIDAGMVPGIKVDMRTQSLPFFPGEKITQGLDGLSERLEEYSKMGARFAKWRAVITIGSGIPTYGCIEANASALARYAALCQEASILPIVEPEVLMDGSHTLEECFEVTQRVLHTVFDQLHTGRVLLEGMILKPNMVLAGKKCPVQPSDKDVAEATVTCLLRSVPAAVPGVVFLSGGQSADLATSRLQAMNAGYKSKMPWRLTFSYSRAIQQPALDLWKGKDENTQAAQRALYERAKNNAQASEGKYNP